ncbi:MAG: hypothetical protein HYX53_14660 [Chloroflexi bacterium]|nr:hypothetical protein [Chloroflexota bacterium]
MTGFWKWGVRGPMMLGLALSIAAGFAGVLDWSPALAAALPFAFIAEGAGWAAARAARRSAEREAARAAKITRFPGRLAQPAGRTDRAA